MDQLDPLLLAGAKAKGRRPWFLENPDTERILNITMALAQELAVTRERLDTVERLLARGETVSKAAIDAFEPTKAEASERGLWTQEFLARILRVLQQDAEAVERTNERSSEDVAEDLAKD